MPRKKGVSKSAEIRSLLEKNRKMKADEIIANLNGRGMKVSKNLVYLVKAKAGSRRRKMKRAAAISASRKAGVQDPVQLVLKVRAVASEAGGMKQLKQLVDALAG